MRACHKIDRNGKEATDINQLLKKNQFMDIFYEKLISNDAFAKCLKKI